MLPTASLLESSSLEIDLVVMRAWGSKNGKKEIKRAEVRYIIPTCPLPESAIKQLMDAIFAGTVTVADFIQTLLPINNVIQVTLYSRYRGSR